jgi:predicted DNA-binding protein (MmcQ/YjbR family)
MLEHVIAYCLGMKGAIKEYPFGSDPMVIKFEGKIFALISTASNSISLKCDPAIAENLREQYEAVIPGYHLNKKHWNTIILDGSMQSEEVNSMILHSYELVFASLPKKTRAKWL